MYKCLVLDASFIQTDVPGERSPCGKEDIGKWLKVFTLAEADCSILISVPNVQSHLPGCTRRLELVKRLDTIRASGLFHKLVRSGKIWVSKKSYDDSDARGYNIQSSIGVKDSDFQYILHAVRVSQEHCTRTIIVTCDNVFFREDVRAVLETRGVEVLTPSELLGSLEEASKRVIRG